VQGKLLQRGDTTHDNRRKQLEKFICCLKNKCPDNSGHWL